MTEVHEDAVPQAQAAPQPTPAAADRGWYLYGITRRGAVGTIRPEGGDEWAVHMYADRAAIEQRVVAAHPTIQALQQEIAAASPGRAYLLQRKLAEERAAATDQALRELAQAEYEHLARWAVAGQLTPPARTAQDAHGEIEVLRAAFLVRRANADTFQEEVRSCVEGRDGVHCEHSGPWAP